MNGSERNVIITEFQTDAHGPSPTDGAFTGRFVTSRLAPSSVRPGRPSYGLTGAPWWAWSPAGQVDGPARERACCELLWGSAYPGLLLDHLVGAGEERGRDCKAESFGCLEIEYKL